METVTRERPWHKIKMRARLRVRVRVRLRVTVGIRIGVIMRSHAGLIIRH